jgi:glucose/arabinose dehydrogenase
LEMRFAFAPTLTVLILLIFLPSIVFAAPSVVDPSLKVETVFEGIKTPSNMAFLGKDTILVLEQNTGIVDRVVNGTIFSEPLLDVNVSNAVERGLLGVAVAKSDKNITHVFLYYTESKSEDGEDDCDTPTHCKSGNDPLGNRLYRYDLVSNKLVNPKLLLDLPSTPGPAHNGGIIKIGPDNNVYVAIGELAWMSTQASNVPQKKATPDGRGGILRVTEDGLPLQGIIGNGTQLNLYYAYGIRNSFGMDFDPVTGNLWNTENGPSFGDEINLVKPGFNSGWSKVQGVWEVTGGLMGKENTNPDSMLLNFSGKGVYSPPEFTWSVPVAPTAIKFMSSDKLGKQYKDDLFVGGANNGNIYHFDLNEGNRTELVLNGSLADRVSNNTLENEGITWGKGFGIITDMQVGPSDGHLYILSINLPNDRGTIFRIAPVGDS